MEESRGPTSQSDKCKKVQIHQVSDDRLGLQQKVIADSIYSQLRQDKENNRIVKYPDWRYNGNMFKARAANKSKKDTKSCQLPPAIEFARAQQAMEIKAGLNESLKVRQLGIRMRSN